MKCGNQAKQELYDTAKGIVVMSIFDQFLASDLSWKSVGNQSVNLAKYLIKNDDKTQHRIATIIKCKLEQFIG